MYLSGGRPQSPRLPRRPRHLHARQRWVVVDVPDAVARWRPRHHDGGGGHVLEVADQVGGIAPSTSRTGPAIRRAAGRAARAGGTAGATGTADAAARADSAARPCLRPRPPASADGAAGRAADNAPTSADAAARATPLCLRARCRPRPPAALPAVPPSSPGSGRDREPHAFNAASSTPTTITPGRRIDPSSHPREKARPS